MSKNTHSDKPIFETSNWYKSFGLLIARLICIGVVFSAIVHFKENPVVTTIAIIGFGFLFFFAGVQSVVVYHDRFDHKWGSLFDLMDRSKTYYYKDIKSISLDGFYTQTFDMIEDALTNTALDPWNSIELEFKDGKRKSIDTWIYKGDLRKAVKYILQEYRSYNNSLRRKTEVSE
jgi:hypothetical protein